MSLSPSADPLPQAPPPPCASTSSTPPALSAPPPCVPAPSAPPPSSRQTAPLWSPAPAAELLLQEDDLISEYPDQEFETRMSALGFEISRSQRRTPGDGNCGIHGCYYTIIVGLEVAIVLYMVKFSEPD